MSRRERIMLIVLGVVAALALLFFVFLRPGDEAPPEDDVVTIPTPTVEPSPSPSPSPAPRLPPLAIFGGRDPFFPLFDTPEPGDGTAPPGTPGTPPPPPGSPGPSPVPPVSPPASPPPGGVQVGGHTVNVLDVFVRGGVEFVQVSVDGQVFTVREGERFAENFKVVAIQGRCATFLFGDEQFTDCEPGAKK